MVHTNSGESIAGTEVLKKIKEQLEIEEERSHFLRAKHTDNSSLSGMLPYLANVKTGRHSDLQAIYSWVSCGS